MNIAWDIDGVLVDLEKYLLSKAPSFFKSKYNKNMVCSESIDLKRMFDCNAVEEADFWTHNLNLLTYSLFEKPRYGVVETLEKLHDDGHKNIIVTARAKCDEKSAIGKIMRWAVKQWIKKNGLKIDGINFVSYKSSAVDKLEICKSINADIVIEDDVNNISAISEVIPVIKFATSYNKSLAGDNIYEAADYDSVYLTIEKLNNRADFKEFNFLDKEQKNNTSKEELTNYYDKYRRVLKLLPFDLKYRERQLKKYYRSHDFMEITHKMFCSKPVVINPEMLDEINTEYKNKGKLFIIASHTSLDDIQQLERVLSEMAFFLVKAEISKYPIVGRFLESIGCIYVQRDDRRSKSYSKKQIEKLLMNDYSAIMLPEGTRNKTENPIIPFQRGAVSIAQNTGKCLIPVAIKRYDQDKKVYLKMCQPRHISIFDDVEEETRKLEKEIIKELIHIESNMIDEIDKG